MTWTDAVRVAADAGIVLGAIATAGGVVYGALRYILRPSVQLGRRCLAILHLIETELRPNGGGSLRDSVDWLRSTVGHLVVQQRVHEKRNWLLHDDAPVGLIELDAEGRIVRANRTYRQITGLPIEELHAGGWRRGVHPDDLQRVDNEWDRCRRDHLEFSLRYRRVFPSGDVIRVRTTVHPVLEGGILRLWIGSVEPLGPERAGGETPSGGASVERIREALS